MKVGEVWRTRFNYPCRIIADDAVGPYPFIGLIMIGRREVPAAFDHEGRNSDPFANDFDLISQTTNDWKGDQWRSTLHD